METKEELLKEVMKVEKISTEQIRQENRGYNASEWDRIIDRKAAMNAIFYVARKDNVWDYNRYFAVYTIDEGITFFSEVSYSSSLTSNGFCEIIIMESGTVYRKLLSDREGNTGRCANDKKNRLIMAGNSQKYGTIYSNRF